MKQIETMKELQYGQKMKARILATTYIMHSNIVQSRFKANFRMYSFDKPLRIPYIMVGVGR